MSLRRYRRIAGAVLGCAGAAYRRERYRRYGALAAIGFARWKVEGHCDHVARESRLGADEAVRLRKAGQSPPALAYFEGRQRVEARLAQGASVDTLMKEQGRGSAGESDFIHSSSIRHPALSRDPASSSIGTS